MSRARWWLGLVGSALGFGCSDLGVTSGDAPTAEQPLIGGQPDTVRRGVLGLVIDQMGGCTGTLLAPNLVLTARHCVAALNSSDGAVQCGTTLFTANFPPSSILATSDDDIRNGVPASSQFSVSQVRTMPGNEVCGNDVALLILGENVPANLAPPVAPRIDQAPGTNELFDAVGYGITDPDDTNGATFGQRLRVNGLHVLCVGSACSSTDAAASEWGAYTPVCSGDSGGPALDASGRVMGVASRGDTQCELALYATVSAFRSLIVDTALIAAEQGGYPPPSWTGASPDGGSVVPQPDGGSADAGAPKPDAGSFDAGSEDASSPDAGMPNAGSTLGEACEGSCAGAFACYTVADDRNGVCMPYCTPGGDPCPFRHHCAARLGVCVPSSEDGEEPSADEPASDAGCGCRTTPRTGESGWMLAALGLALAVARRRY